MTQCRVIRMPRGLGPHKPGFETRAPAFARKEGVRYLITMDGSQPWPFWHIPQHWLGGPRPTGPHWILWHYDAAVDSLQRVPVDPATDWPAAVPVYGSDGR